MTFENPSPKGALLGFALLLVSIEFHCHSSDGQANDSSPPNIIIIYTDDQGFGDTSSLNPDAKFQTPNLDRLAMEGISFTNAHSPDTVCTPSRYGLLTGRFCWRTEKKSGVLGAEHACLIRNRQMTLASFLGDNGYDTAMVGKWHLGMDFPGEPGQRDWQKPVNDMPLDKGFDYFYGVPASLNYGVLAWFENRFAKAPPTLFTAKKNNNRHSDYRIQPPYQRTPEATQQALKKPGMEVAPDFIDNQCLTKFTDQAIQWMSERSKASKQKNPFFLYLPLTSPHYPVCPLPEFWGQGQCGGYGEFLIETDHHVGRILSFLKKSGMDHNTLVIFSSDNGPENSWKNRIKEFGHHSNHHFRGGKRDIYEGGHRVPLFARWPAGIKNPGRQWSRVIGQVDLLATFAELLQSPLPENAGQDSQSFASVLIDADSQYKRAPLINHSAKGQFSITHGDWKLILPHRKSPGELYNLNADPGEKRNVIAQQPEVTKRLKAKATEIVVQGRTTPGIAQANDTGYWNDLGWITRSQYEAQAITEN